MYDYLVDHARKNVWCTPNQDLQAIVKPARISSDSGVFGVAQVMWRQVTLPLPKTRFHLYQVGQLHPLLMGLMPACQWTTLTEAMQQHLIVDVYANSGVQLPRCEIWYMVTPDKDLILAVKEQPRIPINLPQEDIFFRVYTNAYFNSVRAQADNAYEGVRTNGKTCLTTDDILALQNEFNGYATWAGQAYAFVNGYRVAGIDLFTAQPGDVVEYVYDSSIKRVIDFPIANLETFNSTLDNKGKYLLHYAGLGDNIIDYHDDNDIFLLTPADSNGRYKGLYYHRNQVDSVRMITHKDYAVPVAYVAGYANGQDQSWQVIENLVLRLHIRRSGYARPLVNENNRIKELYKLSDADLQKAFLGVDSLVTNWRADTLETAAYEQIMREQVRNINRPLVESAYGYNAISKLLCDTPRFTRPYSGETICDVPYGLQQHCVGYEYDNTGLLLGSYSFAGGSTYVARNYQAALVEMLQGYSGTLLDETYGEQTQTLDPTLNYRMYTCAMVAGVPNNQWVDVTGGGQYAVIGNQLTWLIDATQYYTLVRSDKVFLAYDLELQMTDGLLKFSLTSEQYRNGIGSSYVMQIPMGELDLFLNGRGLIEGIDYIVNFPEIVIFNKEYLVNPDTALQRIDIRFCGFCKSDFSREVPQDYGFIQYGLLSENNRFDIRDDKVMRIVVDGYFYDRSELKFAESDSGVTVPDVSNGRPYMIRDIVTPLRGLTNGNTYTMRSASQAIDKVVSDYMTLKIPQPTYNTPSAIAAQYQLVSPFMCKILYDLLAGVIDAAPLKQFYNDMYVMSVCKPYEYLLTFDPTQDPHKVDPNYTVIHPHPLPYVMNIDIYYYSFLMRVNNLYLNNMVQMSETLALTPAT